MPEQTGVLLLLVSSALAGFVALGLIAKVLEAWLWAADEREARTHDAPMVRSVHGLRMAHPITGPGKRRA